MSEDEPEATGPGATALRRVLVPLLFALALLPLAASVAAVAPGWVPTGDDATIALRGRDLLTADTPLVGMPSTVGQESGEDVHHPGPLEMWWVGVFERTVRHPVASMVAVVLVTAASVVAALHWARRLGGDTLLALAAVVVATMLWSLRGEILVSPFNPFVAVVPLGAFLVALVAAYAGIRGAGLGAALLGSWVTQAHLTMAGPVVAATVAVAAAAAVRWYRSPDRERWRPQRRSAVVAAVLVLCWLGPIVDVVVNGGGNVRAVLASGDTLAGDATVGARQAAEVTVNALSWRPGWATAGRQPVELNRPPTALSVLVLGAVVGVAAVGAVRVRRRRPTLAVALAATLAAATGGTLLAARVPATIISALALHNELWLWPVGALLWVLAAVGVAGWLADRRALRVPPGRHLRRPRWRELPAGGRPAAVGVVALLAVGAASLGTPHRTVYRTAHPVYVRALHEEASTRLDRASSYRMGLGGAFETYGQAVGLMYMLERDGFEVVADEELRTTFGDRRVDPDRPVLGTLVLSIGRELPAPPSPDAELVAVHRPDRDLLDRQEETEAEVVDRILRSGLELRELPGLAALRRDEVERWVAEDLPPLAGLRFLPAPLLDAPEVAELTRLLDEPVRFMALYLVPDG